MQQQFVPPQQKLKRAVEEFQKRNLRAAESFCREVLADQPYNADALHLLGLVAYEVGQGRHAVQLLQQAIVLQPNDPHYRTNLGKMLASQGAINESIKTLGDAVRIGPDNADAHFNLGNALYAKKEFNNAEAKFAQALKTKQDFPAAANNMGIAMIAQGKVERAIAAFRLAINLQASFVDAHVNLGRALREKGELDSAIAAFQSAIRLNPALEEPHVAVAQMLNRQGHIERSLAAFRDAIRSNPNSSSLHAQFGDALLARTQLTEAISSYRTALELDPSAIPARINLGAALRQLGNYDEAIAVLAEALKHNPNSVEAYHNLGNALRGVNRFDDAAIAFDRALKLNPAQPQTLNSLGLNHKDQGQIEQATNCFREAISRHPDQADGYENLIYNLYFHPEYDSRAIHLEHARWNERFANPLQSSILPHTNDRHPDRKLRIGYVSPDFFSHCQSLYTIPLLSNHDKTNFEVTCYSNVRKPDALTSRIQGLSECWRNISGVPDDQAAEMIRQDQIDILVDLTLHMGDNRLMIFARKPAPVQVSWLGYPGTTGLGTMDYRLTDPHLDPLGTDDLYVEKSIRLPDSFWCYDPLTENLAINPLPAKANGHVTFGCLNNFCKINEPVLELWAKVLRAVPDSQLVLLADPGTHRERVLQSFHRQGINAAQRVQFVPKTTREKYLEYFHQIDIALDTFPYNGHTTSLDGFWMGVPVVTLVGDTVVGRAGLSQLSNLSLTELAANDKPEFVRIAAELATDLPRLENLRSSLRSRMQASALMDAPRFARNIEQAYRDMWHRWAST